jgi:hypothetical protein
MEVPENVEKTSLASTDASTSSSSTTSSKELKATRVVTLQILTEASIEELAKRKFGRIPNHW